MLKRKFNIYLHYVLSITVVIIFLSGYSNAQWVNNPEVNTLLASAVTNPVNITSVEDLNGGAFIFWEENRSGFQSEIYFLHLNGNGRVTFRVDGKKVSENADVKENPIAVSTSPGSAVVIWKASNRKNNGDLFAQKVTSRGQTQWPGSGLRLSNTGEGQIIHYAADADVSGNVFLVFTEREDDKNDLHFQKISSSGILKYDLKSSPVVLSETSKSLASVIADNEGGAYLVWLETVNNKSQILSFHIDGEGKSSWGKTPLSLSGSPSNIISFSVKKLNDNRIYIAWQTHKKNKYILHQLIDNKGRQYWQRGGKPAIQLTGDQLNPQVLTDSTIILSWTQDSGNDRDVYIQKYDLSGQPLWDVKGIPVIRLNKDQFGQRIVTDGKGGAIVTWIDRRDEKKYEHLFSQRVSKSGKLVWDTLAIPVASHPGSEKSYLSVISDSRGGIIAIFKDKRDNHTGIYGQKVFNTGTYISQILGFQTIVDGDSVVISWYSANETGPTTYEIERAASTDTLSGWTVISNILSDGESTARKFELKDKPDETGTIYYRLIKTDDKGNIQPSDISRVNYYFGASDFTLAQNSPNPFSDSTVIKFYLPEEMNIHMEFFNSHIEKIGEIKNRYPAGESEVTFLGEGLQQGIYFYRFEAGDFVDVKKMVVVE